MTRQGNRRERKPKFFEVVVVPGKDGGNTRRYRLSVMRVVLMSAAAVGGIVGVIVALMVWTPIMMYIPIPAPALEARYGRQLIETQTQLNQLASDVLLLRDYNMQLRRALGERIPDSLTNASSRAASASPPGQEIAVATPLPVMDDVSGERGVSIGTVPAVGVALESGISAGTTFPLLSPVQGFVSQGFDPPRGHFGMDIAGKQGSVISAAADGIVVFAGWTMDDGHTLILSHGSGYLTVYKHNQMLLKSTRSAVKRGEPIALLGTTGESSEGPHLHFEVWNDGIPQDPNRYLLRPVRVQ